MATLTKRDLVVRISSETGLAQSRVQDVIQQTLDLMIEALAKGQNVELRNFGVLEVRLTRPRIGRNPNKPGSSFVIPPRATVKFKAGKIMRQEVAKLSPVLQRKADRG
jgi:nucleoid DNA-binding protein